MKFILECFSGFNRCRPIPFEAFFKYDGNHDTGYTLHEILKKLEEQGGDYEMRATTSNLKRIFNREMVKRLDAFERFYIFVDSFEGTVFVREIENLNTHQKQELSLEGKAWLSEYLVSPKLQ